MGESIAALESDVKRFREGVDRLAAALGQVIAGQEAAIDHVLCALLAGGHVLLEGAPGLGKTLLVRTLAHAVDLTFSRIQFTPDLMPADITGTNVVVEDPEKGRHFRFQRGPVFAHLVLADEINRATPKTQSALLEAMQESGVTVAGQLHPLPGTVHGAGDAEPDRDGGNVSASRGAARPLPAQGARRRYPDAANLAKVIDRTMGREQPHAPRVMSASELISLRALAREVVVAPAVRDSRCDLVLATHPTNPKAPEEVRRFVRYGASPRGAQALIGCAKVQALRRGRAHADTSRRPGPRPGTLRHRLILNFEGEAEGLTTDRILESVAAVGEVGRLEERPDRLRTIPGLPGVVPHPDSVRPRRLPGPRDRDPRDGPARRTGQLAVRPVQGPRAISPVRTRNARPKRSAAPSSRTSATRSTGQECCRGIGKILCPKCKDPVVKAELEAELEARKAWVDQQRKVDKGAGLKFAHVETDHWILHSSQPAWKIKVNLENVTLNRVKAAHLWADRLEDTATFVQKILGSYPAAKQTCCIVINQDEMMRTTLTVQGVGQKQTYKTFGNPSGIFTTYPEEEFTTDELFHPHVVHSAVHILLHATHAQTPMEFMHVWVARGVRALGRDREVPDAAHVLPRGSGAGEGSLAARELEEEHLRRGRLEEGRAARGDHGQGHGPPVGP